VLKLFVLAGNLHELVSQVNVAAPKPCPVSQRAAVRSDLREEAQIVPAAFSLEKTRPAFSNSSGEH